MRGIVEEARAAQRDWAPDARRRATALEAVADALERARAEIIATAVEETALTPEELAPEFARMVGTLRMFAGVLREGSWVRATVDGALAQGAIGPGHDCRSMLAPLDGVVAVFGASNFPLAYGVCGGDTASAWAAGCPVVVKEHPAHPKTGRLIAEAARAALVSVGQPAGLLGYVENADAKDLGPARELVTHSFVKAVGFTGSTTGGMALDALARSRRHPIPVFAEMGSMNLVMVLRHAFEARREQIADDLAASLLSRHGQQCTKPGMVLVAGRENGPWLFEALAARIAGAPRRRMLSPAVAASYWRRLDEALASGAITRHTPVPTAAERGDVTPPVILEGDVQKMSMLGSAIYDEIFGPALIVVPTWALEGGYFLRNGMLAATLIADERDFIGMEHAVEVMTEGEDEIDWSHFDDAHIASAGEIARYLATRSGRMVFNGVPTGVRVCGGMVHGGPYPATNAAGTTAVGPRAMERWCRPVCWQNWPELVLPAALRRANPLGIMRQVNGAWTREPG